MKKKLLILGAGNAQIDLIDYCKSAGLEVHGVSYTNTDKGIPMLDHFQQINIIDVDAVESYVRENEIDYVYSVGSDIAVPTFCEVAERTGKFHFISPKTAEICCNKQMMREAMGQDSKYNVPYMYCSSLEEAVNVDFYPLMIKPVDSQGQRGVFCVHNYEELAGVFHASIGHSKSGKVILEKYIDGTEVSVNAYVKDSKVIFNMLSDRESYESLPGGIIKAHHLPSVYEGTQTQREVDELVQEAVTKMEINNGPCYFQIKVCDGHPYLIEVTPRLDGCHMWRLINMYCGVNLLELTMAHFLTGEVNLPEMNVSPVPMHTEFFCEPPETAFDPDKFKDFAADFSCMYYQAGDKVRRMNGFMEKCGYRIYSSPKRVGVIGGSGLVGQYFCKQYGEQAELVDISRASGTVSDYTAEVLTEALRGCDSAVILAAKKVNPKEPQSLALYYDNMHVVEQSLQACRKLGINSVVYVSSRCVYDNTQESPISEEGLIAPINYYGISKYTGEQLCEFYNRKFYMNIKVLRLSQVLAAGQGGYVLDTFIRNAKEGKPLQVYGNGIGQRDYIYVKDVSNAIWCALTHTGQYGVFNIGSGKGTTAKELAEAVKAGFASASEVVLMPEMKEDTSISYLDVSKAAEKLGFSCQYGLTECFSDIRNDK